MNNQTFGTCRASFPGILLTQATFLVAASNIQNEVLNIGKGVGGLLGLGPQAESIVTKQISSGPATFSTTLFSNATSSIGLAAPGPSAPFISLLLERPYYPTIPSRLGLGMHPPLPYSLSPSQVQYSPIISSTPGPLYWRVPITQVTPNINGTFGNVPLGGTNVAGVSSIWPLAVFDSAEAGILSSRSFANAFYGSWGIGPGSQDGQCKL